MANDLASRVERECNAYDQGLERDRYCDLLVSHAGHHYAGARQHIAERVLEGFNRVLEIGEKCWFDWLESSRLTPHEIACINISERELAGGVAKARFTRLKPQFRLADAHALPFRDGSFDAVIGSGILHHLDLPRALGEIQRVLRPGGRVMFSEPLDMNPVGRLVRRLTPNQRTKDETPFRREHLRQVASAFEVTEWHFEQLLGVPAGIASRFLFFSPDNPLTRTAFAFDRAMQGAMPWAGPWFRKVTFAGRKATKEGRG